MSTTIDGYDIDAFVTIDPSMQNRVTPYPVEEGADASDHIVASPKTLMLTGIVSDTPMGDVALVRDDGVVPSSDAYARLVEIHETKRLVTIETDRFPAFKNMALRSLNTPASATSGEALMFRAVFEQVTFATISALSKETVVELPRHKKAKRKGHKTSKSTPDAKKPPVATSGRDTGGIKYLVGLVR